MGMSGKEKKEEGACRGFARIRKRPTISFPPCLASMDLVSIKAELKSWEKAFRSRHGRDPKKEDIKADAHIGTGCLLRSLPLLRTVVQTSDAP
jgi:hypothetical protein